MGDAILKMTSYSTQPEGLCIETNEGRLQLVPYAANIIRVRYTFEPPLPARESLMIVAQPVPGIAFEVQETPHMLVFTTSAIEIQIQKETTAFVYCDRQG